MSRDLDFLTRNHQHMTFDELERYAYLAGSPVLQAVVERSFDEQDDRAQGRLDAAFDDGYNDGYAKGQEDADSDLESENQILKDKLALAKRERAGT